MRVAQQKLLTRLNFIQSSYTSFSDQLRWREYGKRDGMTPHTPPPSISDLILINNKQ